MKTIRQHLGWKLFFSYMIVIAVGVISLTLVAEFIKESHQNKRGTNKGRRTIWFNGRKTDKNSGRVAEHCKPQFMQYVAEDFQRIVAEDPK